MMYQIEMYNTENYVSWDDARKQGAVYTTVLPAVVPETVPHYTDHTSLMTTVLAAVALTSKCLLNKTDVLRLCVRQI